MVPPPPRGCQMCIKLYWSVNSVAISESSSRQKVRSILGLSNIETNQHQRMHEVQEETELSRKCHGRECSSGIEVCAEQQHSELIVERTDIGSPDEQHKKCLDE